MSVWDPNNRKHLLWYKDGQLRRDMFVTMGPMNRAATVTSWLSMTGAMPRSLDVDAEVKALLEYPGCWAWSQYWGWNANNCRLEREGDAYSCVSDPLARKYNVICMQELQIRQDPTSGQWTDVTCDKGHWGSAIYPGCADVFNGVKAYFEIPGYMPTKSIALN